MNKDLRIWKFEIPVQGTIDMRIQGFRKILKLDMDPKDPNTNKIYMWALVDPTETQYKNVHLRIIGTGHPVENDIMNFHEFVDTVFVGPFVWHVFRKVI